MPIPTKCPSCGKPCTLPDTFKGGSIRCPTCQATFAIPIAQPIPSVVASPPPPPSARPLVRLDPWRILGVCLLVIGFSLTLYYLLFFDTTVSTIGGPFGGYDERVHSLGRMNEKQVSVIAGIGISIVGAILCVRWGRGNAG